MLRRGYVRVFGEGEPQRLFLILIEVAWGVDVGVADFNLRSARPR